MEKLNRSNLRRATIVNGKEIKENVKGYLISADSLITFPENENDGFQRYFVPTDDVQVETCETKHLPYVKSNTRCIGFDRTFDGLKSDFQEYIARNIASDNDTLNKIMSIPENVELIQAVYVSRDELHMTEDAYYRSQCDIDSFSGRQEQISKSVSILRYLPDGTTEIIPLIDNPNAVYELYHAYHSLQISEVYISKMDRLQWEEMNDYQINRFLSLYFEYMKKDKNKVKAIKR